jgi:hypothetical protein
MITEVIEGTRHPSTDVEVWLALNELSMDGSNFSAFRQHTATKSNL